MSVFVWVQKTLPKKIMTECAGWLAQRRWPLLKNALIRLFRRAYAVDLAEAVVEDPSEYDSFNDFFTRALKPSARPICAGHTAIASPADGVVSTWGSAEGGALIQAKGIYYGIDELVASSRSASSFESGTFMTIYLSPRDYHRVHVPIAAELIDVTYVPGQLFSVNDQTARSLDGLFTRNERIVATFRTPAFEYALVMVGAMIVGGMATCSTGVIARQAAGNALPLNAKRAYEKGEEFGQFHLGSTVVLVFPAQAGVVFNSGLTENNKIKMGESVGQLGSDKPLI